MTGHITTLNHATGWTDAIGKQGQDAAHRLHRQQNENELATKVDRSTLVRI